MGIDSSHHFTRIDKARSLKSYTLIIQRQNDVADLQRGRKQYKPCLGYYTAVCLSACLSVRLYYLSNYYRSNLPEKQENSNQRPPTKHHWLLNHNEQSLFTLNSFKSVWMAFPAIMSISLESDTDSSKFGWKWEFKCLRVISLQCYWLDHLFQ